MRCHYLCGFHLEAHAFETALPKGDVLIIAGDLCHAHCLDPAYASSLDEEITTFENVPVWVHGHTHITRTYRIGNTAVRSNALGFAAKGGAAPGFSVKAHFEIG